LVPPLPQGNLGNQGTVACDGDSGGPLSQDYGGQTYLLGMVSWGPDSCNPDDTGDINSRNPDVYTDVRFYKSWIEEETSDLGDPFDEVADSTQQLAPNCGGSNCFRAHDGACSFIESPFFQCNDKVIETRQQSLSPDDATG
jgi:secreted trypsin-like serine protease